MKNKNKIKEIIKYIIIELIYILLLIILFRSGLAAKIWDYIFIVY